MSDQTRRRLRQVAMTGVLTPGLLLGMIGSLDTAQAAAQSTLGACTAFGAPSGASNEMSIADIAAQAEPAIVTVVNLQQMSGGDLSGLPGVNGLPDVPLAPGSGQAPSGQGIDGAQGSQGDESLPEGADDNNQGQSSGNVPAGTGHCNAAGRRAGPVLRTAVLPGGQRQWRRFWPLERPGWLGRILPHPV